MKMLKLRLGISLAILLASSSTGLSDTLLVPQDYPTIQQAINAAKNGDIVLVSPDSVNGGSYRENINFAGKAITLKSSHGPEVTTIDGQRNGAVFIFYSYEGPNSIIDGFTITNGYPSYGGGLYCYSNTSPTIMNNIITGNEASMAGGAIYCSANFYSEILNNIITGNSTPGKGGAIYVVENSRPKIRNNIIIENSSDSGGAIFCFRSSSPEITDNTIAGNSATTGGGVYCYSESIPLIKSNIIQGNIVSFYGAGIYCENKAAPVIMNNHIIENSAILHGGGIFLAGSQTIVNNLICKNTAYNGAGIYCDGSSFPAITNTTFSENTAGYQGGGISVRGGASLTITNTILWNNHAPVGPEAYFYFPANQTITYCVVKGGWPGEGNINSDPLFVNVPNNDFHVRFHSPCIDGGSRQAYSIPDQDYEGDGRAVDGDRDGNAEPDIGADELLPETAARYGNVNAGANGLANVLLVNSSPGDGKRVCSIPTGTPVTMTMNAPPAGPNPSNFALYLVLYEPGLSDIAKQPFYIGNSSIPMPLGKGNSLPPPTTLVNNLGHKAVLGHPLLGEISPAPCTFYSAPSLPPGTYTLQGYICDNGSGRFGISLTNAIVVKVP